VGPEGYRKAFSSGATLHLDVSAHGDYDTGIFAYNFIRRGEQYGLRPARTGTGRTGRRGDRRQRMHPARAGPAFCFRGLVVIVAKAVRAPERSTAAPAEPVAC
jgi:hypothetical protein